MLSHGAVCIDITWVLCDPERKTITMPACLYDALCLKSVNVDARAFEWSKFALKYVKTSLLLYLMLSKHIHYLVGSV